MISNAMISSFGLCLDIVGVLLMWKFGLPPNIHHDGQSFLILESVDENEKQKTKRYDKIAHSAVACILLGFIFQIIGTFPLAVSETTQVSSQEVLYFSKNWSPDDIVNLFSEIAWPIATLCIAWRLKLKDGLNEAVSRFLSKNQVTEFTAGATGVTAKFTAAQQQVDTNNSIPKTIKLTDDVNYENIITLQKNNSTELSKINYDAVKNQLDNLSINDAQKIELLTMEVSLLQAANKFLSINKSIFRSQFDLLNNHLYGGMSMTENDISAYFDNLVKNKPETYYGWDYIKYIAFLISTGLLENSDGYLKLTIIGNSYIGFMRKNINLIDELNKF